jgi:hypothetical protein
VYYDRNTKKRKLKPGDKVLLLLPTSASKLLAEWKGPYEVIEKKSSVDYVIRVGEVNKVFHINMLKLFNERLESNKVEQINVIDLVDSVSANDNYKVGSNLSMEQVEKVHKVVGKHEHVFNTKPGKIDVMEYEIQVDNYVPRGCVPYKIPFHLKDKVREELNKWLELGIIRKSNSQYCHPAVIVKNSDGSIRIAIDYRKLNPHIATDNYPMPLTDSVIGKLHSAKFISKLDLTKAYFNIQLTEESKKYTSFVTEFGQFEFTVVPFGIKFASGLCNRIIKQVLDGFEDFVDSFVDDLIVFSNSFEEHIDHIDRVFRRLEKAGLNVNRKKCIFAADEVKFLGFVVGNGQIKPDKSKLEAIEKFPRPVNKKQMRSFVGLVNFYRKFAPHIATYLSPLNEILKKQYTDKICWTESLKKNFENIIKLMVGSTPLYLPKPNDKFVLQTDACDFAVAAVLWQRLDTGDVPIAFASKKLTSSQMNYPIIEKECYAIRWAVEFFHEYLVASEFIIKTDHAPLKWLHQNKNVCSRRMRWSLELQTYTFHLEYIKGKDNLLADVLSRNPVN